MQSTSQEIRIESQNSRRWPMKALDAFINFVTPQHDHEEDSYYESEEDLEHHTTTSEVTELKQELEKSEQEKLELSKKLTEQISKAQEEAAEREQKLTERYISSVDELQGKILASNRLLTEKTKENEQLRLSNKVLNKRLLASEEKSKQLETISEKIMQENERLKGSIASKDNEYRNKFAEMSLQIQVLISERNKLVHGLHSVINSLEDFEKTGNYQSQQNSRGIASKEETQIKEIDLFPTLEKTLAEILQGLVGKNCKLSESLKHSEHQFASFKHEAESQKSKLIMEKDGVTKSKETLEEQLKKLQDLYNTLSAEHKGLLGANKKLSEENKALVAALEKVKHETESQKNKLIMEKDGVVKSKETLEEQLKKLQALYNTLSVEHKVLIGENKKLSGENEAFVVTLEKERSITKALTLDNTKFLSINEELKIQLTNLQTKLDGFEILK